LPRPFRSSSRRFGLLVRRAAKRLLYSALIFHLSVLLLLAGITLAHDPADIIFTVLIIYPIAIIAMWRVMAPLAIISILLIAAI
jgi:hypothetical protein